jgi:NADP-reducing hydrogenase subunit HndB
MILQRLDVERLRILGKELRSRKQSKITVTVHMGTCGIASGAEDVLQAVLDAAKQEGQAGISIKTTGCAGLCSREPMLTVQMVGAPPVKYIDINPAKARRIYSEHVLGGKPVSEYALGAGCESMH